MELICGEKMSEGLARGRPTVPRALELAAAIASGVADHRALLIRRHDVRSHRPGWRDTAGRRTIASSSRSSAEAGLPVRPVWTGDGWMMVLRGATSQ
jgi:hypothetical protein